MIDGVVCGDNLEVLPQIEDESVDLIVTDPPYGIKFMGRDWDKAVPSVEVWKECLRVLKPGAFAFVMCIPRQDCFARMCVNMEDAGFEIGFTSLFHAFASGFPKASKREKNEGLEGMPEHDMWMGHANQLNGSKKPAKQIKSRNHHPCCKPLKLGSYLVTIGSREGDLVLDPFGGTGWIGIVCKMLKRRYIVIELEKGYCEIAEKRIAVKEAALV